MVRPPQPRGRRQFGSQAGRYSSPKQIADNSMYVTDKAGSLSPVVPLARSRLATQGRGMNAKVRPRSMVGG